MWRRDGAEGSCVQGGGTRIPAHVAASVAPPPHHDPAGPGPTAGLELPPAQYAPATPCRARGPPRRRRTSSPPRSAPPTPRPCPPGTSCPPAPRTAPDSSSRLPPCTVRRCWSRRKCRRAWGRWRRAPSGLSIMIAGCDRGRGGGGGGGLRGESGVPAAPWPASACAALVLPAALRRPDRPPPPHPLPSSPGRGAAARLRRVKVGGRRRRTRSAAQAAGAGVAEAGAMDAAASESASASAAEADSDLGGGGGDSGGSGRRRTRPGSATAWRRAGAACRGLPSAVATSTKAAERERRRGREGGREGERERERERERESRASARPYTHAFFSPPQVCNTQIPPAQLSAR